LILAVADLFAMKPESVLLPAVMVKLKATEKDILAPSMEVYMLIWVCMDGIFYPYLVQESSKELFPPTFALWCSIQ